MKLPECNELLLELKEAVLTITLNRPQKRNAMNLQLVEEVIAVFTAIDECRDIRAVVLRGAEGNFCAGGDISGMNMQAKTEEQATKATWEFNRIFGRMITQVNHAPQLVITLLEGAVLGGGFGLVCISDVAIADSEAMFALPETGLGIIPAQIAPFVVSRIGLTQARKLALLGERINGEEAKNIGIVHFVTNGEEEMNNKLGQVLKQLKRCAPQANAVTKQLLLQVGTVDHEQLLDTAADAFCTALRGEEGQEGTQAFLQKRPASWNA